MPAIKDFLNKYHQKIDNLDLELLIAAAINKPREFVLTHPEYKIPATHNPKLEAFIQRRLKNEPIAYILGTKEFYGLEFKVNKNTLIPRPETELLVEQALQKIQDARGKKQKIIIIDLGTGSGNIIISIAKTIENFKSHLAYRQARISNLKFIAIDISAKALAIAKQNAKFHKVSKKITFLQGNLLIPFIENCKLKIENSTIIIVANLPYLSKKVYNSSPATVINYEPKSALVSNDNGLSHYKKLFKQIKKLQTTNHQLQTFIEFSPEQKNQLKKAIQIAFPRIQPTFFKDLAGKFRVARIEL